MLLHRVTVSIVDRIRERSRIGSLQPKRIVDQPNSDVRFPSGVKPIAQREAEIKSVASTKSSISMADRKSFIVGDERLGSNHFA